MALISASSRGGTGRSRALRSVLVFVKENLTFTGDDPPMSTLLLSMLGAVAEFERSMIRERQREGIELAKAKGVYKGRKPALNEEQTTEVLERLAACEHLVDLAREFGVSRATVYNARARAAEG